MVTMYVESTNNHLIVLFVSGLLVGGGVVSLAGTLIIPFGIVNFLYAQNNTSGF